MFCLENFFVYVLKYLFNGISKYLVNEATIEMRRRALDLPEDSLDKS